ncbi:unnamed protein product [Lampetra planeri]
MTPGYPRRTVIAVVPWSSPDAFTGVVPRTPFGTTSPAGGAAGARSETSDVAPNGTRRKKRFTLREPPHGPPTAAAAPFRSRTKAPRVKNEIPRQPPNPKKRRASSSRRRGLVRRSGRDVGVARMEGEQGARGGGECSDEPIERQRSERRESASAAMPANARAVLQPPGARGSQDECGREKATRLVVRLVSAVS